MGRPWRAHRRRRRLAAWILVASVLSLAGSSRVSAQSDDPDPDFSLKDTVQLGPFHAAPFLVLKDLGYDDNTRLGASNSTGDFTSTIGPGARAVAPIGRLAAFSIWDEIDYAFFAKDRDLNHINNSLRTKVHLYLRDFTVYVDGAQDSNRDRPNTEIDYRIRNTATEGKFGTLWKPATRAKLDLFLQRDDFHYDPGKPDLPSDADPNDVSQANKVVRDIATNLERQQTLAGLIASFRVRPRTSLLLDLRSGRIDFDRTEPQRDSSTTSWMGGLEFDPIGSLRGYLKLGSKQLTPDDRNVAGFSGLIADASLSARLLGRGQVSALYQRDTGFSILDQNLFYIFEKKALGYEHFINSRLSVKLGRELENVHYPIAIPIHNTTRLRNDFIVSDDVSFRYRLGPSLRVGLAMGRWNRDSTFNQEDAVRHTITTLLEYTP